jgi:AraC-like DNA-binding protein
MWELASELVDPHANARWMASYRDSDRKQEGIALMPNYVVAVAPSWRGGGPSSAAEAMIWTHEFQRCSAAVARELPNTIAGRVGGEAAFFLTYLGKQRKDSARSRLIALGERIGRLIRRKLKVDVVCGFSGCAVQGGELPIRYDQALCAVFWGLHKHQTMTFQADAGSRESAMNGLYGSARVLCQSFAKGEHRETFVAAERVVRDVLWISMGSLEVMRSHFLQILWELLALTERRDVVDERTSSEVRASFSARLGRSRAIHELTCAFTQLIRELLGMLERPSELGRRAKLERARRLVELAVLERGARETPLDLASVAARVGMSRASFARSFQLTYKTTLGAFVLESRIERSKQLLRNTKLRAAEVGAEAGWSSASYFHQAFKRITGMTPEQYRAGSGAGGFDTSVNVSGKRTEGGSR